MDPFSLQFAEITLQIANCRENTRENVSLLTASSATQLVFVSHVWVAKLCARAAGSEIIAAPQSYTMFSTGSP
jgi:hypothetical protein